MHMKANLLDGVGGVGAGERQVLKGSVETPELSQISNRRPRSGGGLGLRVHGRGDRLAVHHASTMKDVESELVLSEEESICLMLYEDLQTITPGDHVPDREIIHRKVKRVKLHRTPIVSSKAVNK
jgi:hypothetical protein